MQDHLIDLAPFDQKQGSFSHSVCTIIYCVAEALMR